MAARVTITNSVSLKGFIDFGPALELNVVRLQEERDIASTRLLYNEFKYRRKSASAGVGLQRENYCQN